MISNYIYQVLKIIFAVGALFQTYLMCFSVPMSYPVLYHLAVLVACAVCCKAFEKAERENISDNQMMVDKVIFHTKTIFDECDFMLKIVDANLHGMKKTILKENDRDKLEILNRKWEMFKAQETLLVEQMKTNKKFHDNMMEMDLIEQDLDNFNTIHK